MKLTLYQHHGKNETFRNLWFVPLPFHELIFCLHGNFQYKVNDEIICLHDKDILYVPQGCYRSRQGSKEQADYISVHFLSDEPMALPFKIEQGINSFVAQLITAADHVYNRFFPNAEPIIEPLIDTILKYTQARLLEKQTSPLVQDIRRFMLANISKNLTISDIANQVLLSPSYCSAMFKQETGTTLMHYFTQLKLEEAKLQLLSNEYSLTEVAQNVGFENYTSFARAFKKYFQCSPLHYKKDFTE